MAETGPLIGRARAYDDSKVLPLSQKDGWQLGLVGLPWPGPWPKRCGDLFVVAPDGRQAGVAWESDGPDIVRLLGPIGDSWGVFQVRFPFQVMGPDDLILNFHAVLPLLQEAYRATPDTD